MLKVTSEKLRQFTPDRNAFHRKGGIGRPHCGIIHMKDICVKVTSEKLRQFTPDRNAFHRKGHWTTPASYI
jgi:hypothetical protein